MLLRRALLLALIASFLAPRLSRAIDWQIQTVDPDGDTGYKASLVFDSEGILHVVYIDRTQTQYIHSRKTGPNHWIKEIVQLADERMAPDAIMLPGDVPAFSAGGMFYVKTVQGWQVEDMNMEGFWCSAVALRPEGSVEGISQGSWGSGLYNGWVAGARREQGVWTYQTGIVDAIFYPSNPSQSLIVDVFGKPHGSFTTTMGDPLRYAYREFSTWYVDELPPGLWSSIALDAMGSPRISYYDPTNQDLVMASKSNGAWISEPLDVTDDVGLYTSHAGYFGLSYVAYYQQTEGDLRVVKYAAPGQFTIFNVDMTGDVGQWPSIAIDAQGLVHVAYYDATNGDLKYAVGVSPTPTRNATLGQIKSMYRR